VVKWLIIADDFTGSLDVGVQFSKIRIPVRVTNELEIEKILKDYPFEVLVVNTETRHETAKDASDRVYHVAKAAWACGVRFLYKKNDSTLRGNIGSELCALLDATGAGPLYYIPAYPKLGRVTLDGVQYINGQKLANSAFAADPFTPVASSRITDVISQQSPVPSVCIKIGELVGSQEALCGKKDTIFVVDGQTDKELRHIGDHFVGMPRMLLAGSAGFAEVLPYIFPLQKSQPRMQPAINSALVVSGSLNAISKEQVDTFIAQSGAPIHYFSQEEKRDENYLSTTQGRRAIDEWIERLERQHVLIMCSKNDLAARSPKGECDAVHQADSRAEHQRIADRIGRIIWEFLRLGLVDLLVVFGGDTMRGILKRFGNVWLQPEEEIFPGIVQSYIVANDCQFTLVTKAGGFGEADTLSNIMNHYSLVGGSNAAKKNLRMQARRCKPSERSDANLIKPSSGL
jgi:uncharacterized protein YgbK (DUF1537 family)